MISILNKLLSKLPFNGAKSAIGAVLAGLVWVFPDFPLVESQIEKIIEYSGYLYLSVGLLHKWIKAKF